MLDRGNNDPDRWGRALRLRGQEDPVWWINTWGVTQNPKDFKDNPHRPLVLFGKQEKYVRLLDDSVRIGRELLLEKSREQGATVVSANYCGWRLMNQVNASMKVGSRVKDLVDGDSFADQIMPKADYTFDHMPAWALPAGFTTKKPSATRKAMSVRNPETGKVWKGEPTNKHFSVSGRYAMVWLDEIAKIETMHSIHKSVANTTNCYLYTTTPEGWEFFARMVASGRHPVFRLHWTDNPLWQPAGYDGLDWEAGIWPAEWTCRPGCDLHPEGGQPHSERYDRECDKVSRDPKTVAQEFDICYHKSGGAVFDVDAVRKCIVFLSENPPALQSVRLDWTIPAGVEAPIMTGDPEAWYTATRDWSVAATPVEGGPLRVLKAPNPGHVYCMGGDTGKGLQHGDASCLPVWDATAGETVAEWYGRIDPVELASEAAKLCKWYGTASGCEVDAWAAVEWNGNGVTVSRYLQKMGILMHRSKPAGATSRKKKKPYLGVLISPGYKRAMIDEILVPLIAKSGVEGFPLLADWFVEFWRECETFVEHAGAAGKINPEIAKVGGMIGCHDDRVMARLSMMVGVVARWRKISGNYGPAETERRQALAEALDYARNETAA